MNIINAFLPEERMAIFIKLVLILAFWKALVNPSLRSLKIEDSLTASGRILDISSQHENTHC